MTAPGWMALTALRADLDVKGLEAYAGELEKWNRSIRLVGPKDREGVRLQVVDALLPFLLRPPPFPLLDIGSGAGLPGVPIALAFPGAAVTCLEPQGKRTTFLRHVARLLGLPAVRVVEARAEEAVAAEPGLAGAFPSVTARAVTDVPALLAMAKPFLAPEGVALLPRGGDPAGEVPGWVLEEDLRYPAPQGLGARHLAIYRPATGCFT